MISHTEIKLSPHPRGFHLIDDEILKHLVLPKEGLLTLTMQHTSAGLTINENADPDVLHDFELYFNHLVQDQLSGMKHTIEGIDDMPAHIKTTLVGISVTVPILEHKLKLGTWQGIYLCEFRNYPKPRTLIASVFS